MQEGEGCAWTLLAVCQTIEGFVDLLNSYLGLVCIGLLMGCTRSCFRCFIGTQESIDLCWGYVIYEDELKYPEPCFERLDALFNKNVTVMEAARVGPGYDQHLNFIMNGLIQPILKEFYRRPHYDFVYERKLQKASHDFVKAVSLLPKDTGCIPPCGFQSEGAVYDCETCSYDSCEFPLDCPVEEIEVMENRRVRMQCEVPFNISGDILAVWRFAEQVKTQLVYEFIEVTSGADLLYSISSVSYGHQGTYQCEIYSDRRSIVRLYYYLSVTPQEEQGQTELQEVFDLALLPGGSLLPAADLPRHGHLSAALLWACVMSAGLLLLLLLLLSLWILCWLRGQNTEPVQ